MRVSLTLHLSMSLAAAASGAQLQARQSAAIPDFVTKYAPLVYLDQNELYLPSDLQAQLNNTYPALNFTALPKAQVPSPLLLSDLEQLNVRGDCSINNFDACPLYLTSTANVSTNPAWLYGVLPDPVTGETVDARSCAIIVNDHGSGLVDAYYMYFYAFNLGETVLGTVLGNHVGDWEHSMVRFQDGLPTSVWLSQHAYGQAFTYSALSKKGSRPLIYSAIGSHANFAVPGLHSRSFSGILLNDTTSAGPLWDPILSAYFYHFAPSSSSSPSSTNGTFHPSESSTPTGWLYFQGRWGDEQYPDANPIQNNFGNLNISWTYESGPTGPWDKQLNRTEVCPAVNGTTCATLTVLPETSGSSVSVTVTRTYLSQSTVSIGGATSSSKSGSASSTGTGTGTGTAGSSSSTTGTSGAVSMRIHPSYRFWVAVMISVGLLL